MPLSDTPCCWRQGLREALELAMYVASATSLAETSGAQRIQIGMDRHIDAAATLAQAGKGRDVIKACVCCGLNPGSSERGTDAASCGTLLESLLRLNLRRRI